MRALGLALIAVVGGGAAASARSTAPAGTELFVRLVQPVATHAVRLDDRVQSVLIAPVESAGRPLVQAGARVRGRVTLVKKVGFGLRREKASLGIVFEEIVVPGGGRSALSAEVAALDNARERVDRGIIRGIRATAGPGTRATSRLRHLPSLALYPDPALLTFKLVFPWFPNPEIVLPAGAELQLRLTEPLEVPEEAAGIYPAFDREALDELKDLTRRAPARAYAVESARPADITNLLLLGSEQKVREAFESAGWVGTDRKSVMSVGRTVTAIVVHDAYERAPMSELSLAGRLPDMHWQKGLNSYDKRHHLRLWRYGVWRGQAVWLGAATHDTGVGLDWSRLRLTHRIDERIDRERDKVAHDLLFTGCVSAVAWIGRPAVPARTVTATGEPVVTGGATVAIGLDTCPEVPQDASVTGAQWGNPFKRYLRRQVLVVRSDLVRANIVWSGYELGRLAWTGLRGRRPQPRNEWLVLDPTAHGAGAGARRQPEKGVCNFFEENACTPNPSMLF